MHYKFGVLLLLGLIVFSCNSDVKFDSEKWKNAGGENITLDIRLNMSNDLIESQILINKDSSEIIKLLGSPSKLQYIEEPTKAMYFIVQEIYGWDIDPEKMMFIKVKFNDVGKAKSAEIFSTK